MIKIILYIVLFVSIRRLLLGIKRCFVNSKDICPFYPRIFDSLESLDSPKYLTIPHCFSSTRMEYCFKTTTATKHRAIIVAIWWAVSFNDDAK